ncbi:MAG: response regulator transcription factor [Thermoguttaceae bacterium]|nr:response regulator transcription factor [Thermoguttaceae bacterium]MDW8037280.1 response regulator transcription factor [Thermoguttaceae bacterium]
MKRVDQAYQASESHQILIVTARRLLAEGLEALFCHQLGWQASWAETLPQAIEQAEKRRPEVAIVDLCLSDGGAFLLFQHFQSKEKKIRVAFLDDCVQEARLTAVQRLHASGYFTLRDSFEYMVVGLRQILAGWAVYPAGTEVFVTKSPLSQFTSPSPGQPSVGLTADKKQPTSLLSRLSRREMEVLIHLARGLTIKQCAEQLHLSPNTVDNHKARLMSKLGFHRLVDLIRFALREKLIEQ